MNKKILRQLLALGLSLALFMGGVQLIQKVLKEQLSSFKEEVVVKVEENDQKVEPSKEEVEVIKKPVNEDISIVRYFYNKDDEASKQEQSLILFEGVYRINQGIDFASEDAFDVVASTSGTITKVTEDPILGWVVCVSHESGLMTTYESLSEVSVELNQTVKQGTIIGKSGTNVYEADLGNHLHFMIEKNGKILSPEACFDKEINEIDSD